MEVIERRILELVLRFLDDRDVSPSEKLFAGEITYPQEFDLASTAELMAETANITNIINSDTLLKALHKRIAASRVGDATSETLSVIMQEIEEGEILNKPLTRTEIKEDEEEALAMKAPSKEATGESEKAAKKSDTKKEAKGKKKKANRKGKAKKPASEEEEA